MNIPVQAKFIEWFYNKPFPSYDSDRNRNGFLGDMLDLDKIDHDALQYGYKKHFIKVLRHSVN